MNPIDASAVTGFYILYGVVLLGFLALSLLLGYLIMKTAIVRALRRARHEQRIERLAPGLAEWLEPGERELLGGLDSSDR